jgi:hypothetical protein
LLTVDAMDRDHPQVRHSLALAWPVDRVFLQGDYLVEIGGATGLGWWNQSGDAVLRVAAVAAPNTVLSQVVMSNLPVVGASMRNGRLYVVQGEPTGYYPLMWPASGADSAAPARTGLRLTVIGLDALPDLTVVGQTTAEVAAPGWGAEFEAVWPRADVLVWAGKGFSYWLWDAVAPVRFGGPFIWWPWRGGGNGRLLAFDVSDSAMPRFVSEVSLATNTLTSFSSAFTSEGRVYLSHQVSEFLPLSSGNGTASTTEGRWVYRTFLNVVDYADPREPLVRQPANIPGQLNGISHHGEVLYTVGTHWTTNQVEAWTEYLDASSYDGVSAHLVDSLRLSNQWPRPLQVVGTNVFLGNPGANRDMATFPADDTNEPPVLETWYLSSSGHFTKAAKVQLAMPATALAPFGGLLAVQQTDNTIELFDATDGAALRRVGSGQPSGCLGFDLSRADGALGRGLWIPAGAYGVGLVLAKP